MNDKIQESLRYDETGMFAETYLSVYLKKFLDNKQISLKELLENEQLSEFVSDVQTLYNAIKKTDAESQVLAEAKKAMDFYNLACDQLDAFAIVELRSSAINCIESSLELLQFSHGAKEDDFKLSRNIYMFEDMDSLITSSIKGHLNGVSLAFIKDRKQLTDSYFAFVIKNGDNLYLLTDVPRYRHPAQKRMKRCPGRDMSNRIESNWFPYTSVGNLDVEDLWNSGKYGISEIKNELSEQVREDTLYSIIGTIDSLEQDEAFWFIMMASLIKEKFYDKEPPMLEMSYTKSMINAPGLVKNENALMVQSALPNISLSDVTIEDTDHLNYDKDHKKNLDNIKYYIDRYADKVDPELLNVISGTEKALMIEDTFAKKDAWGKKVGCDYLSLDLNTAGTKEEIEYQQKWIARYNFAEAVEKIAYADFKEKQNPLYATIKEMLSKRLETLVKMHLRGELTGFKIESKGFAMEYTDKTEPISEMFDFDAWYNGGKRGQYVFGKDGYNKADMKCAFTGKHAGVVIRIAPGNAKELAMVCGIPEEDLPIELQHYDHKSRHYYGNSILNNIDPFLSLDDWYNTMDFGIIILLSKTKYLELCKAAGVEAVKFWELQKPECFDAISNKDVCHGKSRRVRTDDYYHYEYQLCKKCEKCKWYKNNCSN